jgi:hypothetical protein
MGRVLVAVIAVGAGLFVGTGTSQAGLDNELSLVDGGGRTLTIQQWDTFLNGVYPLDRNRLTRRTSTWTRRRSSFLGNGPGIQEVATFSTDVTGPDGGVAVSNAHGTVTGAAGGVLLRPFARLISKAGDSVTTYGEAWNMN